MFLKRSINVVAFAGPCTKATCAQKASTRKLIKEKPCKLKPSETPIKKAKKARQEQTEDDEEKDKIVVRIRKSGVPSKCKAKKQAKRVEKVEKKPVEKKMAKFDHAKHTEWQTVKIKGE